MCVGSAHERISIFRAYDFRDSVDLEDDLARRVRLARIGCRGVSGQRQWVEAAPDLYGKLEAEVVPRTMAMIAKNFH
jgi:hypothetical protein